MPNQALTDRQMLEDIHAGVAVLTNTVAAHDKTLYGNGQPGVCRTLQIVETRQIECPARRRNWVALASICVAALSTLAAWVAIAYQMSKK